MECTVHLFARARDLAGAGQVRVVLPENATVADLRVALRQLYPRLTSLLEHSALAVDEEFAADQAILTPDAEIALLPPVSGGESS